MPSRNDFAINRRSFLKGTAAAGVTVTALPQLWSSKGTATPPAGRDILVCLFLRGGFDGLSAVVPYQDADYYTARPNVAIPANQVIDLDGQFGLHPGLAELHDIYLDGDLAVLHAIGHAGQTRSHFFAQAWLESGNALGQGWVARHFDTCAASSVLRGVSVDPAVPISLRGAVDPVFSVVDAGQFSHVGWPLGSPQQIATAIDGMYADPSGPAIRAELVARAQETRGVMNLLDGLDLTPPPGAATYPATDLGGRLEFVASLIRARAVVPIEAICLDLPRHSVDLHSGMGTWDQGSFYDITRTVAPALSAFWTDLALENMQNDVTIVVVSEFGRQLPENSAGGTDHGFGGCMFVMGGGINGGMYTSWPGLSAGALVAPGALDVTTDYRDVLAEVLTKRLGNSNVGTVFPGLVHQPLGVAQPRV